MKTPQNNNTPEEHSDFINSTKSACELETEYKVYAAYCAAQLAEELHQGQTDKAGKDYFKGHLSTVGSSGHDWKEMVVGFLHDAAEDTPNSVDDVINLLKQSCNNYLRNSTDQRATLVNKYEGIIKTIPNEKPHMVSDEEYQELTQALHLLNSHTAENREAYIARYANHDLAIRVKLNDLTNNMDISRIAAPTEKDYARVERYKNEYKQLLNMLNDLMN